MLTFTQWRAQLQDSVRVYHVAESRFDADVAAHLEQRVPFKKAPQHIKDAYLAMAEAEVAGERTVARVLAFRRAHA
jgi:hypothetical protein